MRKRLFLFSLCGLTQALGDAPAAPAPTPLEFVAPWLTGPLLSPSAIAVPKGYYEIEPYVFEIIYTGIYNKHWKREAIPKFYQTNVQVPIWFGFAKKADVNIIPQFFYNATQGVSSGGFGDLPITLDLQLVEDIPSRKWVPAIKVAITETFPTGKYNKLNPNKLLTDGTGFGTYATTFSLTLAKVIGFWDHHYLSSIITFSETVCSPVSIHGLSTYNGDPSTRGTIYPANIFRFIYGAEFTLSKHWVIATDITFISYTKTRFKGRTIEKAGFPSSEQLSLSPAVEYNFNNNIGIITGVWFSIAGRNDNSFIAPTIASTFYYSF